MKRTWMPTEPEVAQFRARVQDPGLEVMPLYGKIESEIAQLPPEEALSFLQEIGLLQSRNSTVPSANPMSCWVSVRSLPLVKKKSVPGPSRKGCWRHKRLVRFTRIWNEALFGRRLSTTMI